jgi:hypothetical protein
MVHLTSDEGPRYLSRYGFLFSQTFKLVVGLILASIRKGGGGGGLPVYNAAGTESVCFACI